MAQRLIVTFHTTSEAMAAEFACKREQIPGKLIPVPRTLSAGCGIAWMSEPQEQSRMEQLLERRQIEWDQITVIDF